MEGELRWKKDETPYFVFACSKCGRYLYVKPSQKTIKCMACNRVNSTNKLKDKIMVKGLTAAILKVKELQNQLAQKELGKTPDLQSFHSFHTAGKVPNAKELVMDVSEFESEYSKPFSLMLKKIQETYKEFPFYIFQILSSEFAIPEPELKLLITEALRKNYLISLPGGSYKIA